tara:strand:- start:24 stop:1514 length:1491 start_codon:yes stop_codon:yes gene_type:complete
MLPTLSEPQRNEGKLTRWPVMLSICVLLLVVAAATAVQPIVGLGLSAALLVGSVLVLQPQVGTTVFTGLLYANLIAVAIKFHGAPALVGLALPVLLLAPIIHHLWRGRGIVVPKELPFVLLFVLAQFLGVLFSRDVPTAANQLRESILEGVLIYLLVVNAARTPQALWHILWALLAAAVVMGIAPILQQLTGNFGTTFGGLGQVLDTPISTASGSGKQLRLSGTIGETNRYAQVMLMLVPVGLVVAWQARGALSRAFAVFATAVALGGFVLAFSRGGAVAAVGVFAAAMMIRVISFRQGVTIAGAGFLLLLAVPQFRDRMMTLPGVGTLIHGREPESDGAVKGRLTEMIAAAQVFADHPIIGVGPGVFPSYCRDYGNRLNIRRLDTEREAHCLYLELGAENGIVGIVGFGGMVGLVVLRLIRQRRRWLWHPHIAALATAALLMNLAYLASAVFLHMSYLRYFWFTLALGSATAMVLEKGPPDAVRERMAKLIGRTP